MRRYVKPNVALAIAAFSYLSLGFISADFAIGFMILFFHMEKIVAAARM
jgi:hypothetical protein